MLYTVVLFGALSVVEAIKSADEVIRIKEHLNSRGVNYLLNVGPDHLGRIPGPSLDILKKVSQMG